MSVILKSRKANCVTQFLSIYLQFESSASVILLHSWKQIEYVYLFSPTPVSACQWGSEHHKQEICMDSIILVVVSSFPFDSRTSSP